MDRTYHYEATGSAAAGQTWTIMGQVKCSFPNVFDCVTRETFFKLTKGEAVFGQPGVGCNGPYVFERLVIQLSKEL